MKRFVTTVFLLCTVIFLHAQVEALPKPYTLADTALAQTLLADGKRQISEQQYKAAQQTLQHCIHIYRETGLHNNTGLADALHQSGLAFQQSKLLDSAEVAYLESAGIRIKNGQENSLDLSKTYNNLGTIYQNTARYDPAVFYLQKALNIKVGISGWETLEVAKTCNNLCVLYDNLGDYAQAIYYGTKGRDIRLRKSKGPGEEIIGSNLNLGNVYLHINDFQRASAYYEETIDIFRRLEKTTDLGYFFALNNLGACILETGDYDRAIAFLQEALAGQSRFHASNPQDNILTINNLGLCYRNKGEYATALDYFKQAESNALRQPKPDPVTMALIQYNIGGTAYFIGNYPLALDYLNRTLQSRIEIYGPEHPDVADVESAIGLALKESGRVEDAIQMEHRALGALRKTRGNINKAIAITLNNLALCYLKKADYEHALQYFDEAIQAAGFSGNWDSVNIPERLFKFFHSKGEAHLDLYEKTGQAGQIIQALTAYDHAVKSIEYARSYLEFTGSKLLLSEQTANIFEIAINTFLWAADTFHDDRYAARAFEIAEQSKSLVLFESVKASGALHFAGLPDSLIEQERRLRVELGSLDVQKSKYLSAGRPVPDSVVQNLDRQRFSCTEQYHALTHQLEQNYPDYYRLKYNLTTVSLSEVQQKLLKPGHTLVEYVKGDSQVYIFVIRPDLFRTKIIRPDVLIDTTVSHLMAALQQYNQAGEQVKMRLLRQYIRTATTLYEELIAPVRDWLTDTLLIAPSGSLHYLPFEALLEHEPGNLYAYGSYDYLLNHKIISYCPSASLSREMSRPLPPAKPGTKSFLGFAPFSDQAYNYPESARLGTGYPGKPTLEAFQFTRIPESKPEIEFTAKLWQGESYSGEKCTKDLFLNLAKSFRIIHLATHGYANNRASDLSFLAFAQQPDQPGGPLLFVREIYDIPLGADLVVLSSCETSQGELKNGEGVISLARAFAFTGARSIVASIWNIDDASTLDIMKRFHTELHRGRRKDESLCLAKRYYLTNSPGEGAFPAYWAGFIALGNMAPLH